MSNVIKAILVGGAKSGKASIGRRVTGNGFCQSYVPIAGVAFYKKNTGDGAIQCWAISDDKQYERLFPAYCKLSNIALVVYDVTDTANGLASAKAWLKKVRDQQGDDFPVILVGSKTDMEGKPKVSFGEAKQLVGNEKDEFTSSLQVSAKTGDNFENLYQEIRKQCIQPDAKSKVDFQLLINSYAAKAGFFSLTRFRVENTLDTMAAFELLNKHAAHHDGAARQTFKELKLTY